MSSPRKPGFGCVGSLVFRFYSFGFHARVCMLSGLCVLNKPTEVDSNPSVVAQFDGDAGIPANNAARTSVQNAAQTQPKLKGLFLH